MKNLYRIILLLLIAVNFYSCDDFLDEVPRGYSIPSKYEDFALLLNPPSIGQLWEIGFTQFLTDDNEKSNDPSLPVGVTFAYDGDYVKNYYYFNSGPTYPQGFNDIFYDKSYAQIYTYNVVINNIGNVDNASEDEINVVKAEALFGRAFNYFKLVQTYGKAYDPATADTDYGVPIILEEDINATYIRNSVQDVYDLVIADLTEAAPLLKLNTSNLFHPSRVSGYLLLSKVYLWMGKYDKALEYANIAFENKSFFTLEDLTKYYTVDGGWYERIVDSRTEQPMLDIQHITENMYIKTSMVDFSLGTLVSDDLMATYDTNLPNGSIDKRRDLYFATDSATVYSQEFFPGKTMYIACQQRNAGMMLSELYLILAEAEARVGSKAKALEYLNLLRDFRITDNVDLTASTNQEALKMILDERRREFSFNADFRYQDLKRLNREPAFAKAVVHVIDGETYTLPPNDPRYILPLPNSVINFNPTIPQYER